MGNCNTSIGTEELAHMEMIAALVYKLTEGASPQDYEAAGWGGHDRQKGEKERHEIEFRKIRQNR